MQTVMKAAKTAAFVFVLALCASPRARAEDEGDGRVSLYLKAIDPNGGQLFFTWRQVEGPHVRIADPNAGKKINEGGKTKWVSDTFFIPTQPGTYKFEAVVKNENGEEAKKIVTREVLPPTPAPIAIAGNDKSATVDQVVVVNGVDSRAAPGRNIAAWEWTVLRKPEKAREIDADKLKERQLEFKADEPGVYLFQLRVFDGKCWSDPSRTMVTVKPKSLPPIVLDTGESTPTELQPAPSVVPPPPAMLVKAVVPEGGALKLGQGVVLDGSASAVDLKLKPEFIWRSTGGPNPKVFSADQSRPFDKNRTDVRNYPVWKFTPSEPGDYSFVLEITTTDEDGKASVTRSDPVVYHVAAGNRPPVAKIRIDGRDTPEAGDMVRLDASASHDPDGDKLQYVWGPVPGKRMPKNWQGVDGPQVEFLAAEEGEYGIQLIVSDGRERATAQISVVVGPADHAPAITLKRRYDAVVDEPVLIEAAIKDPEDDRFECKWTCIDPSDLKIPDALAKNPTLKFVPRKPGNYMFKIAVSDAKGHAETATALVVVAERDAEGIPPTAILDGPTDAVVGQKVRISGGNSKTHRKALAYHWKQEPAENGPKIGTAVPGEKDKYWEFTATEPGRYMIGLVVNDGVQDSEPARFAVDVAAAEIHKERKKPVAAISGPDTAKLGSQVELSALRSHAEGGADITTYIWTQPADGGPALALDGRALEGRDFRKRDLRFKAGKAGTYVLTLKVVDSEGQSSEEVTHKIEVKGVNRPPRAVASVDFSGPVPAGKELKLSTRGSLDPEGGPLKFRWRQLSGPPVQIPDETAEVVNIAPKAPGDYEFELVANDGDGDSPPATLAFTVKPANTPPVAVIAAITPCEPGEKILLDASQSRDADGDRLEYAWSRAGGPEAKFPWRGTGKQKVEVTLPKEGEYVFELKVFDGKEWSTPARASVKTRAPNQAPVAAFADASLRSEVGIETVLDGAASSDPDHGPQPLSFTWRQTEGPRVELHQQGAQARFTPKRADTYRFELRVGDGKAESHPAEALVGVLKAGSLPVAVPRAIPNPVKAAQKGVRNDPNILELNGMASTPGAENKGAQLNYTWKQVGGEDLRLRPADLAKPRVGVRIFVPGKYRFQLTVSDGQATSPPASIDVEVLENQGAPASGNDKPNQKDNSGADAGLHRGAGGIGSGGRDGGALLPPPRDAGSLALNASEGTSAAASDGSRTAMLRKLQNLARSTEPEAEKTLISALSSNDNEVRDTAARSLCQRGINSIPGLIGVLEGGSEPACGKAQWALEELTQRSFKNAGEWKAWWAEQPASKSLLQ